MPNPFAHVELNTGDLIKSKKFYQAVFAWKLRDTPGMDYTMIDVGKGAGGGMARTPKPNVPSAWLPYVEVEDVTKTLAAAKKAGAKITLDTLSIGDMGAIGVFVDPTGASLGVWQQGKVETAKATAKAAKKPAAKKAAKAPKPAKAAKKKAAKKR